MQRRSGLLLAVIFLAATVLSACGNDKNTFAEGKVNVVTTFYPLYYLASEIGGEDANVVNLIPAGVEPHDWTPKSKDLQTASKAQLFIYNGAGLEGWADDFLHGAGSNGSLKTVEASSGIALISGNPEEEEHEHEGEEGHEHASDVDPHTWVSPKSALVMADNILKAFVDSDPANEAAYESRYEDLQNRLKTLDEQFTEQLQAVPNKDIVVTHQAFGYLARDYGLNQVAIMGLSPEAEPRAQDLLDVAKFVKDNGVRTIFFEELVSNQMAKTISGETGADIDVLNPIEGLTSKQEKDGETYISLMERNLQNLVKALQ
ncbi:metal ABC transporter solute-binding protein, Zn/Mn family [Cohnella thailandensis]|uniref:Zinc ABC transporter substrate-binding protein n=1 Tax=Cohnella thailandensis TaxID=557557 RepID=A0A841SZA1_9BACL|nr:zinc ABC transporter substrate-binding protein [Cohnella thailandensis]MBB6635555.1 zinc ABC transporter substrate-binding protein [Cohnella thailandensis]